MRFRKGSEVEVFHSSKVLPAGSWRPAIIIRGNGRTYTVQYSQQCCSSSNNNTDEERVPRKALRPPPPVKGKAVKWAPDDLVEVFVHGFWKPAKVTGVAYGNEYYFVSLFGQRREVAVKKSNLRKRCAWENGKWVMIKKVYIFMFPADYIF
jgi:Agenet domain